MKKILILLSIMTILSNNQSYAMFYKLKNNKNKRLKNLSTTYCSNFNICICKNINFQKKNFCSINNLTNKASYIQNNFSKLVLIDTQKLIQKNHDNISLAKIITYKFKQHSKDLEKMSRPGSHYARQGRNNFEHWENIEKVLELMEDDPQILNDIILSQNKNSKD